MILMLRMCSLLLLAMPLQALELTFPKLEEAKRTHGELVSADFVQRAGQFLTEKIGEPVNFTLVQKERCAVGQPHQRAAGQVCGLHRLVA